MADANQARKRARERLGVGPYPAKTYGDGIDRVAATTSRDDDRPSGEHCGHCGLEYELGYRPDPCIGGYLPGVAHACCGHGREWQAYVSLGGVPDQCATTIPGERTLRGPAALAYIELYRHLAVPDP